MQINYNEAVELFFGENGRAMDQEKALKALEILAETNEGDAAKAAFLLGALHLTVLQRNVSNDVDQGLLLYTPFEDDSEEPKQDHTTLGLNWLKKADNLGCELATLLLAKIYLIQRNDPSRPPITVEGRELGIVKVKTEHYIFTERMLASKYLQKIADKDVEACSLLNKFALDYFEAMEQLVENPQLSMSTEEMKETVDAAEESLFCSPVDIEFMEVFKKWRIPTRIEDEIDSPEDDNRNELFVKAIHQFAESGSFRAVKCLYMHHKYGVFKDQLPSFISDPRRINPLERQIWQMRSYACQQALRWAETAIVKQCSNAASKMYLELVRIRLVTYAQIRTQETVRTYADFMHIKAQHQKAMVQIRDQFPFNDFEKEVMRVKQGIKELKKLRNFFGDEGENHQLKKIGKDITHIFLIAQAKGALKFLFNDFISDLPNWLITLAHPFEGKHTSLLPSLSECACTNHDNFNRLMNNRRETIESEIIEYVKTRFSNPSGQVINYLSLGSGGLLEDFIIITKLMLLGYSVNINIIGSGYIQYFKTRLGMTQAITRTEYLKRIATESTDDKERVYIEKNTAFKQFEILMLAASESDVKVTIDTFESVDEFNNTIKTPQDLIAIIDHDNFYKHEFDNTIKAHKCLHPEGKMFLSFKKEDYTFSKTSCLKKPVEQSAGDYIEALPIRSNDTLHIAVLNIDGLKGTLSTFVIPYIIKHSAIKKIILTIPNPQTLNHSGRPEGVDNPNLNMTKECYQYFLSLFLPSGIELQLNYIAGHQDFKKLLPQLTHNQDLVICYGRENAQGTKTLIEDLESLHTRFPNADFLCAMHALGKGSSLNTPIVSFQSKWIWNAAERRIQIMSAQDPHSNATLKLLYANLTVSKDTQEAMFKASIP